MAHSKGDWKDKLSATGERIIYVDTPDGMEVICRDVRHWNTPLIKAAPNCYERLGKTTAYLERFLEIYPKTREQGYIKNEIALNKVALAEAESEQ